MGSDPGSTSGRRGREVVTATEVLFPAPIIITQHHPSPGAWGGYHLVRESTKALSGHLGPHGKTGHCQDRSSGVTDSSTLSSQRLLLKENPNRNSLPIHPPTLRVTVSQTNVLHIAGVMFYFCSLVNAPDSSKNISNV